MEDKQTTPKKEVTAPPASRPATPKKAATPEVKIEPLPSNANSLKVVEALLKTPGKIIARLQEGDFGGIGIKLFFILSIGFLIYGLVTGSFSGNDQLWIAPLKIWLGLLVIGLICFPSFYIFACLGQADLSLKQAFVLMFSGLTLVSILLIGFTPVALVFSTSTESVAFMGFFHLLFWLISVKFGMRLIFSALKLCDTKKIFYVQFWVVIFTITSLQMMCAIRPIIGTSETILPAEKKFFVENWTDCMGWTDPKDKKKSMFR